MSTAHIIQYQPAPFMPGYEGRGLAYEACTASLAYINKLYTL
ncbi:hypothetical protein [Mucilaginibacter aurantiaciroseus]|nr:hypothetical protein [Mucilaginibacter aurantiaciroseus]